MQMQFSREPAAATVVLERTSYVDEKLVIVIQVEWDPGYTQLLFFSNYTIVDCFMWTKVFCQVLSIRNTFYDNPVKPKHSANESFG